MNFILSESPSLKNRALNYGDGCFSTMLSNKGSVELIDWHVARLIRDAKLLHILNEDVSISPQELKQVITNIASEGFANKLCNPTTEWQIIKLLIIRGDSDRGYAPSSNSLPVLVPSIQNYTKPLSSSIKLGIADLKLASQPILSGAKHLNRIEQVMAKLELKKHANVDDLVLSDGRGMIIELTSSNLFYLVDGVWHTPSVTQSGVDGVARQFIVDYMQRNNIVCVVSDMHLSVLKDVEAAFSCNAVTKVVPVESIQINKQVIQLNTQKSRSFADKINEEVALSSS
ncbi:aminodeoxychorismate lyase [Glaciecola sp.]|jgi:4-amino-4-deoxychorismate lyase|uniref:aminodeoxychorismate lyase n=1 Tax=Glaciecola sp. MF2-115 TaxID=3384827 RepID=UPI00398967A4